MRPGHKSISLSQTGLSQLSGWYLENGNNYIYGLIYIYYGLIYKIFQKNYLLVITGGAHQINNRAGNIHKLNNKSQYHGEATSKAKY